MRATIHGFLLFAAAALLLVACETPPPQNSYADITFEHLPDIRLDVGEVVLEQAYKTPGTPPNVDHLFPQRPSDVALRWAGDRLVAAGTVRRARFIVREASVVEVSLETKEGVEGAFTIDQSERYDAKVMVELQIFDGGHLEGTATAEAWRSVTVPEDASLNERERVWYRLTEDLMADLNRELEEVIKKVYGPYLVI